MKDVAQDASIRPSSIPEGLPREAIAEAAARLLGGRRTEEDGATLALRVRDERVSVRELGVYLTLIDRIYGRLRPGGLRSYAQLASEQLRLRRIAADGSTLLEIEEEIGWSRPWRIAVLYIALKVLPGIVEGSSSWAEAFRELRDGADAASAQVGLFSVADGSIRGRLGEEPALAGMRRPPLEELALLLEEVYAAEAELLPAALRFAQAAVLDVGLRPG